MLWGMTQTPRPRTGAPQNLRCAIPVTMKDSLAVAADHVRIPQGWLVAFALWHTYGWKFDPAAPGMDAETTSVLTEVLGHIGSRHHHPIHHLDTECPLVGKNRQIRQMARRVIPDAE